MNKVKILLKSSVMALASVTITTNPLVQSILWVESICAEDLFNVEKFGRDRKIVDHFVDRNIKCSGAQWALNAINSPTAKFSESMKLLKDFIAIANKDRMDVIHCGKKRDITAIDDLHKVRISKLSDSVNAILREDSENKEHAEMEIAKWKEAPAGKKVLGLINSIMVNETLNIINAKLNKGMKDDELKEFINGKNHSGRSVLTANEASLYDCVFEKVYWSISNCSVQQDDGSLLHTHRGYHCYRDKLLRHFDPEGGTSGEEISSDRFKLMDKNFKKYLYHDFCCYLKQIGIIYNLEVADQNKGNKTVEPAYKQIAEMSDIINELCSDGALISTIKSNLETNGVKDKYYDEVLKMLPEYLKSQVPNIHELSQTREDKKTWLISDAKDNFMSNNDVLDLINRLTQQNNINDKPVKTDQSQNQIVDGTKNVGNDINGIQSNKNVHTREDNDVKNDRQQENEDNIVYNVPDDKINKNVENKINLEENKMNIERNVGHVQKNLTVAQSVEQIVDDFMNAIKENHGIRSGIKNNWEISGQNVLHHEAMFEQLPQFLKNYLQKTNQFQRFNSAPNNTKFLVRVATTEFLEYFNKLQSNTNKTIKKKGNKTINTKNNDVDDNINSKKIEHGTVLNNKIVTDKIIQKYECSLNEYNPSIRTSEQIADKKDDSNKPNQLVNEQKENNSTNINNTNDIKSSAKSEDTSPKENISNDTKNVNIGAEKNSSTDKPIVSEDTVSDILNEIRIDARRKSKNREFSLLHEVGDETKKEIIRLGGGDIEKIKDLDKKINKVLSWIDDESKSNGHEYTGTWVSLYVGKDVVVEKILEKDLGYYDTEKGKAWLSAESQSLVDDWQKNVGEQKTKVYDSRINDGKEKNKAIEYIDIETVVENIFQKLDEGYNITSFENGENVKAKIKELKCDKRKINEWVVGVLTDDKNADDKNEPNENNSYNPENQRPVNQNIENGAGKNDLDEKVDQIYAELEDNYGISGFIDEEAAKDKIRELKCDREVIIGWIENSLMNGE